MIVTTLCVAFHLHILHFISGYKNVAWWDVGTWRFYYRD